MKTTLLFFSLWHFFVAHAQSPTPKNTWSAEKCKTETKLIQKKGDSCLPKKVYAERRACFFSIGPALPPGYFDACQNDWKSVMLNLTKKDKQMYPKDCSAVTDDGTCKQPTTVANKESTPPNPWTPDKCRAETANALKKGNSCLSKKVYSERRACFFSIGPAMPKGYIEPCMKEWTNAMAELTQKDKQMYPKDCSAVTDNGTCKQAVAKEPTAETWTPDKCRAETANAVKTGNSCLSKKVYNERRACFFAIGPAMPKGYIERCMSDWTNAMAELTQKDKQMYPTDCSAVTDNGTCKQANTSANKETGPAVDCAKIVNDQRSSAMSCISKSSTASRKVCLDDIFSKIDKAGQSACSQTARQLAEELKQTEKQKWPKQDPSLE